MLFWFVSVVPWCLQRRRFSGPRPGGDIIDRSGRSIGTITAFGSVVVNGVTYDVSRAVIIVNDQAVQESALAVGQVAVVDGLVDSNGVTGSAQRVTTDPVLRGVVESVDPVTSTLTALGITVNVVASTVFDPNIQPAELITLVPGDSVEVFGYIGGNGQVTATRLQRTTQTEVEVRGVVTALDVNAQSFVLNGLSIDYANALFEDFARDIANGDLVEVEGMRLASGTVRAGRVELETETVFSAEDENTEVEIEGLITNFVSATEFAVNGVAVTTNSRTEFEAGSAANLALDVRVEVEGVINAQGILIAQEIDFEQESNLEVQGFVEAVTPAASELTVLGIVFKANSATRLIDESDAELRFFMPTDVAVGDFVVAKSFVDGAGSTLDFLKRTSPEDKSKISGLVSQVSSPALFVEAAQIATNGTTEFELRDATVSAADFFAAVSVGDKISAEGDSTVAGVLTATKVELDD